MTRHYGNLFSKLNENFEKVYMHAYADLCKMAAPNVVVNELLYYVNNFFGKTPSKLIIDVIEKFKVYSDDDIVFAKDLLYDLAEKSDVDGLPRRKVRKGDGKKHADCSDLIQLFEELDKKKVTLPKFAAVDAHRVPAIRPDEIDVVYLAEEVSKLKVGVTKLLSGHQTAINIPESVVPVQPAFVTPATNQGRIQNSGAQEGAEKVDTGPGDGENASKNFADCFRMKDEDGQWFTVQRRKPKSENTAVRRIFGNSKRDDAQSNSSRDDNELQKSWHIFAGRLHSDITAEILEEILSGGGIGVRKVWPLKKTEKWHERYSAFHVVVDCSDKDNVFEESLWPKGADVRDWIFPIRRQG